MASLNLPRNRNLPPEPNKLRVFLIEAVEEVGLSRVELHRRTGLSVNTIQNMLLGRKGGTIDSWNKILEASGVELGHRINWKKANGNG